MDVLGALYFVAGLLIFIGFVLIILGLVPPTRARVGDTAGWGLTLVILGAVILFALLFAGSLTGVKLFVPALVG